MLEFIDRGAPLTYFTVSNPLGEESRCHNTQAYMATLEWLRHYCRTVVVATHGL